MERIDLLLSLRHSFNGLICRKEDRHPVCRIVLRRQILLNDILHISRSGKSQILYGISAFIVFRFLF